MPVNPAVVKKDFVDGGGAPLGIDQEQSCAIVGRDEFGSSRQDTAARATVCQVVKELCQDRVQLFPRSANPDDAVLS